MKKQDMKACMTEMLRTVQDQLRERKRIRKRIKREAGTNLLKTLSILEEAAFHEQMKESTHNSRLTVMTKHLLMRWIPLDSKGSLDQWAADNEIKPFCWQKQQQKKALIQPANTRHPLFKLHSINIRESRRNY